MTLFLLTSSFLNDKLPLSYQKENVVDYSKLNFK